ncbi:UNVERIFIED_CONTAM: hypothetical protein HDU68_005478, partial [Siphonaria sp. JEL0065]
MFAILLLSIVVTTLSTAQTLFGCYPLSTTPTIVLTTSLMDPVTCTQHCTNSGSSSLAFIAPNGKQFSCGCGNDFKQSPSRVPAQCDLKCPSDSSKPCGGYASGVFYWSVYSIPKPAVPPSTPPVIQPDTSSPEPPIAQPQSPDIPNVPVPGPTIPDNNSPIPPPAIDSNSRHSTSISSEIPKSTSLAQQQEPQPNLFPKPAQISAIQPAELDQPSANRIPPKDMVH